jgi:hypothetical protein
MPCRAARSGATVAEANPAMPPFLALAALLLAVATPSPGPPPPAPPTPQPNRALGPPMTLVYHCANGGMVQIGLTAHAASVLYNGRASVYARSEAPDGGILLAGSGMQWLLRARSLTLTRGVGPHAVSLERCAAVGNE